MRTIDHNFVTPDAQHINIRTFSLFQPPYNLRRSQHFAKREPKPPQPRLMLFLIGTPTRILHKPSLIAPIERAPGRGIAAAVRHNATNNHPLHRAPFQHILQIRINKSIIRILRHDPMLSRPLLNLRYKLPVPTPRRNRAIRPPFAHELIAAGRGEFLFRVAVLREDELEVGGVEMVTEFKDVGEGGGGHAEEDVLDVDDEEGCSHDALKLDEGETGTCRANYGCCTTGEE